MKTGTQRSKAYTKLIRKFFLQMLVIFLIAVVLVIGLRSIGRGYIGNGITEIISNIKGIRWESAAQIYHSYIRNNIDTIILATILLFFVIIFRCSFSWFTGYFDEIVRNVDKLAEESTEKITMSPELGFMEEKLNQVKNKLEQRARATQEAEQRKNDLVVYLAHDIKTPLTSVIGYLNLLDEIPDMPETQKEKYIAITLKKAYHLEKLINEFFEITRYNLQTTILEKEKIDLYYMLVQMTDEFYPMLEPHGKKIILNADQSTTIYGDSDKLARVFNNILKNAIAYSDHNSHIEIITQSSPNAVMIQFVNTGSTIPAEKLSTIFEKFYRLDKSRSTNTGGAGLGLAIAKEIVILHGGTITAQSANNSTIFTVTLPNPTDITD